VFGIPYSADVYYPHDLYNEYKNLSVQCDANFVTVSVNNYRNLKDGLVNAVSVKDGLLGLTGGSIASACGGNVPYMNVFSGKGSPGCITTVLEFVYSYRQKFIKTFTGDTVQDPKFPNDKKKRVESGKGEWARMLAKHATSSPQTLLQTFADKYVGLDCNGFVGNFVNVVNSKMADANTYIGEYYKKAITKRQTLDEIDIMDIVIWGEKHIAVVDGYQWVNNSWRFSVAQSTGGGPQIHMHTLLQKGKGVFNFQIVHPKQVPGDVKVLSLGLYQ
jgi:hypothetical protein